MSINAQPFNPTFKLIGNLLEDQVLTYDSSENAFVNTANAGSGGASGYTAVADMGTGTAIYYGDAGSTLQLKTIIGGADITITDNGSGGLIVASTSTDTIQTATNLGSGTGIFDSKDGTTHTLQFKSIVAGAGLTLTDDGAGTLTLVNDIAAGTTDADLTLSNLSNVATARTNLDVHSKAESDALYHKHDGHFIPNANNTYDIGSSLSKYNDVYAETFHGTAILADNLTTSGTTGQVLTYNGSTWTAADTSGGTLLGLADVSAVAPNDGQHLVWNATTSLWTPSASGAGGGGYQDSDARNAISVAGDLSYNATTGVISYTTPTDTDTTYTAGSGLTLTGTVFSNTAPDQTVALTGSGATTITGTYPNFTIASTDTDTNTTYTNVSEFTNDSGYLTSVPAQAWSTITGTPTTIAGYGITDRYANTEVDAHLNTSTATANQVLKWTGTDYAWVTSTDSDTTYTAGTGLTLTGTVFSMTAGHFDGAYTSLTGAPTTVSSFTNDANYLSSVPPQAFSSLIDVASAGASEDNMVLYYDHATTSFKWKTDASTPAGYNNTNWDTAFGWGDHSTAGYLTSTTAHYTDSDVDTHLNVSGATNDQMLKWTGTDFAWVTSTDTDTTYTAGTGLLLTGTVFSNTSPDQTVALTGTGATTVTGTYPNFTIDSTDTNTDTNTEYTAGTGLTLAGTVFSLTSGHFDGAYSSLTGAPTIPSGNQIIDWTVDQGATNIHVDNYTDTNTTYSNLSEFTNDSGYLTTTGVLSSHTDVHTAAPSDGDVLKWDNANSRWAASADAIGSVTATSTTVFTNKSGAISQWTNDAGYLTSETDSQTLSLSGTTLAITGGNNVDLGALTIDDMADVNITSVADNQFLKYDNASGDWLNETVTIPTLTSQLTNDAGFITSAGTYDNADVDTHINQSGAGTGQVLTWSGTDYSWTSVAGSYTDADARLAISGTTGLSYNNTTGVMALNASVDDLLDVNSAGATLNQVLKWNGTAWSPALDIDTTYTAGTNVAISGSNVISATDTNTTYVSSDFTHDDLTGFVANEHIDWTQSGAGTIHASNYTDTNTDTTYTAGANVAISGANVISATDTNTTYTNVSEFTNDSGYLVSSDLSGYALTSSLATVGTTGLYSDLSGTPTMYANSDVDSHLNQSNPTSGYVLSWNGSDYSWVAQSGGGSASDKIEEGNSSVEVIDGGANGHVMFNTNGSDRWQVTNGGHILPETDAAYDLGSAEKKVRHLFLSDNSLYIEDNTIKTSGTNLLFNDEDVMDYSNLKNKPDTSSAGTGIQVNSGVISLNSALSGLTDVHTTAATDGQVLAWDNGNSRWAPAAAGGTLAMNDLTDVDTSGISSGQYLQWNGSAFIASTVSGGGASAINDLSDVDTNTSSPSNGDVLTWVQADSEWAPAAPSGGGGSGSAVEYFKLNYATNGNLISITNATSGISATILSATGGDVEISFSGTNYPPAGILLYGYAYPTNEYVIMPLNKDITTRKVAGGGSAGSPIAFGTMGSVDLTLKLREVDTGASRSFGTDTHAWIMFTVI